MTPVDRPPTTSGTKTADNGASPWSTSGAPTSADRPAKSSFTTTVALVSSASSLKPLDRDRLVLEPHPTLDDVREMDHPRVGVEDPDVDDLGVEDLLEAVTDQVVHGLGLEVLGQAALHRVDQGQLGVPLPRLLEQPGVLERDAQAPRQGREQARIGIA